MDGKEAIAGPCQQSLEEMARQKTAGNSPTSVLDKAIPRDVSQRGIRLQYGQRKPLVTILHRSSATLQQECQPFGVSGPPWGRVILGYTLNTLRHVITKKSHNVLSKCMILGWATFTAILGHTWPEGRGSAAGAWCWKSHQCCRSLPSDSAGTRIQDPFLLPRLSSALYQQSVTLCQLARKSV